MKKYKAEKPLDKNPNKITNNQHIIPREHLLEWSSNGKSILTTSRFFDNKKPLSPDEKLFCAQRLWLDSTERQTLKQNEDNYQRQISYFKENRTFKEIDHVTGYYLMLLTRIFISNMPRIPSEQILTNVDIELSKEELELEEIKYREDPTPPRVISAFPSKDPASQNFDRTVITMLLNKTYIRLCSIWEQSNFGKWQHISSLNKNFVLSDALYRLYEKGFHILPITPTDILISMASFNKLKKLNQLSVENINKMLEKDSINFFIEKE